MRLYLKDTRSGSPTGYDPATDQIVGYNRAMATMDEYRIIDLDDPDGWTNDPDDNTYTEKFTDEMIEQGLFAMVRPQVTGVLAHGIGSGVDQKEPTQGDENTTKLQDVPGVGVLAPEAPANYAMLNEAKAAGLAAPQDDFAARRGLLPAKSEAEKSGLGPTIDEEARSDGGSAEDDNDPEQRRVRAEQLPADDDRKKFNPAQFVKDHQDDEGRTVSGKPLVPGDEQAEDNSKEAADNKAKEDKAAKRREALAAARKAAEE